jgi:hypothetical protein
MTSESNRLLTDPFGLFDNTNEVADGDKLRVWLIGSREQINFGIHEFIAKQVASDRGKFTPIVPFPLMTGKFISILVR